MSEPTKEDAQSVKTPEAVEEVTSAEVLEGEEEATSAEEDSYFSDDEEVLHGVDRTLTETPEMGIYQQMENVIHWEITNFYKEEGEGIRGARAMKSDPPVFLLTSSNGDSVEFLLTQNLVTNLAEAFENVQKGYYGIAPKEKKKGEPRTPQETLASWGEWAKENKIKAGLIALLVILMVVNLIIN